MLHRPLWCQDRFCWLIIGICSSICDKHSMWPLKDQFPENLCSVIIYSTSGHSKTSWLSFFRGTQKKIFWLFLSIQVNVVQNNKEQNRHFVVPYRFGFNHPKMVNIILKPLFWSRLRVMWIHEKSRDVWFVCIVLLWWIFTMNRLIQFWFVHWFGLHSTHWFSHYDSVSYQLTGGEDYLWLMT